MTESLVLNYSVEFFLNSYGECGYPNIISFLSCVIIILSSFLNCPFSWKHGLVEICILYGIGRHALK